MEHSTTVRAESVEKAIKIGLTKLGITNDQALINVISEGKKGLFGFGKQDAIVEISKNASISELTAEIGKDQIIEKKEDISVDTSAEVSKEIVESNNEKFTIEAPEKEHQNKKESHFDGEEFVKHTGNKNEKDSFISEHESVARYLEDVIREYGADATISVEQNRNNIIFNIETDKSGLIIGKHGKIINALQILAQIMVHQYDKRRQSVLLNIGDYRNRRASVLEQIAERTAKEVLKTKRAVVLDPLPSYERKQIHAYLSRVDHIETHSEGKDPNRYLVVEYKG